MDEIKSCLSKECIDQMVEESFAEFEEMAIKDGFKFGEGIERIKEYDKAISYCLGCGLLTVDQYNIAMSDVINHIAEVLVPIEPTDNSKE